MEIGPGRHLAYCTNVHRGEDWEETFAGLQHTLRVREQVAADERFAIGLRLSARAAERLADPAELAQFRRWLDRHDCYVFTINGFPYGQFHGSRVKEEVYRPDWTTEERLDYTCRLFDILSELVGPGGEGSISTCPGSYKTFDLGSSELERMREQLHRCLGHIEALAARRDQDLHLGLEPEPLGTIETSAETVAFLESLVAAWPGDEAGFRRHIGVNYDTCHLAVEYESAAAALGRIRDAGFRVSKLHLSSALRLEPTAEQRRQLQAFADDIYLHQVIARNADGTLRRYSDLPDALAAAEADPAAAGEEWRVHFHIPIHHEPAGGLRSTRDHLEEALDVLADDPAICRHLEMETYTWEVLPDAMHLPDVVDQLVREYGWCLPALEARGLREPRA